MAARWREHLARVGVMQNLSAYVLHDDCALPCVLVLARRVTHYYEWNTVRADGIFR